MKYIVLKHDLRYNFYMTDKEKTYHLLDLYRYLKDLVNEPINLSHWEDFICWGDEDSESLKSHLEELFLKYPHLKEDSYTKEFLIKKIII